MTAADFRLQHGDPTGWTVADFESYEVLADTDLLPDFTLYMHLGTAPDPIPTSPTAA